MRRVPAFYLTVLALCLVYCSSMAQSTKKPNIIFILADDLGYADVGCYGQKKIETPNIDRLALSGMRFTSFYAGSTVCAPSRAAFMTGLHTGHAPVRGNVGVKPEGQFPMTDTIPTIAKLLRQNGYETAAFGKWGLGFITTTGDPQKQGFNQFYGYNCQTLAHDYYPNYLWLNHQKIDLGNNLETRTTYSGDLIQQQAMQFVNKKHEQPFFLYLPYTLPHADLDVPHDSVYQYYVNKFGEAPLQQKPNSKQHFNPYPHAAYAAMVARLDRYVGEIMAALKAQNLEENTLILFSSDNGPHKENGNDPEFFNSNGMYTGIKRDLYEGGIRVPFIASYKGKVPAGSENTEPFVLYDLFPTFLELAGIKNTVKTDGISMLPALQGRQQPAHDYLYWELHEAGGKQAVRQGKWKAVRLAVSEQQQPTIQLFNLASDPAEKHDLSKQFPAVAKKMESIILKAHTPDKNWPLYPAEKQ